MSITGLPKPKPRGGRGIHYDDFIRSVAPSLLAGQAAHVKTIDQLRDWLNVEGVPNSRSKPWSYGGVYRALRRALKLGFAVQIQTVSQSATRRRVSYRAKSSG